MRRHGPGRYRRGAQTRPRQFVSPNWPPPFPCSRHWRDSSLPENEDRPERQAPFSDQPPSTVG